jgi:NAD+ synthetase
VRIALAQNNVTIGDFLGIEATWRAAWERARSANADVLLLPELATTGYPPRDLLARPDFIERNLALVDTMTRWTAEGGPTILAGCILPNEAPGGNDFFNAAVVLRDGEALARIHKSLLPSYDVFDEDRYFEPATSRALVEIAGVPVGITICEDIWSSPEHWNRIRYPVDPCAELAAQGAQVLFNLSASPFVLGKPRVRHALISETARTHAVPVVYLNQVGAHDELIFDGHSIVAAADGTIIHRLAPFEEDFRVVELTPDSRGGTDSDPAMAEEEEAFRALVLGTRDYVRKSGFERVLIGLSGGIDSALTAVIAAHAIGPENVHCIAMPTRYSSDHSIDDARSLAQNLGMPFSRISIDEAFQSMLDQMAPLFGDAPPDITEENIQARLRGMTLMALSNKSGALVLATSNKSELAVGYCTLYGDMCGALAVIGDVQKTLAYRISRWINRDGEVIPPGTIQKPPSAELRPDQEDADSLPPYEALDAIIGAYVERHLAPDAIAEDTGLNPALIREMVTLIDRAEFKRRQSAPVLKITPKAFGVGRRIPIVARHR